MKIQVLCGALIMLSTVLAPSLALAEEEGADAVEVAADVAAATVDGRAARAWWIRYPAWMFLGLIAGLGLGKLINRRLGGLVILLPIWGLAGHSLVTSHRLEHSLIPPILCFVVTVLLSGVAAKADRAGREIAADMRAGRHPSSR